MSSQAWSRGFRAVAVLLLTLSSTLGLAVPRTFVASTGFDTNPCSVVAPCRTFSAAIAVTDAKGEVIVLDSAGYGPVTITKSVSIIAPAGVYAGISASTGNAITITAGAGDVVTLRGLKLNNILTASHGIQVNSVGELHVGGTEIAGFGARGIDFAASGRLFLNDSTARNNGEAGVHVQAGVGSMAFVAIDRSRFVNNGFNGVVIATNAQGAITNSVAEYNGSVGFLVDAGGRASISDCRISAQVNPGVEQWAILVRGAGSEATVSRCDAVGSFYGIAAEGIGARLTATDTTVHHSSFGFLAHCGGRAVVERCAATASGQTGYLSWDNFCVPTPPAGAESRMYVSNSVTAHGASCDFRAEGGTALMFSRDNNTAVENASACIVTDFTPR
jgi:hypothetical protein